jgi:hypothetical protein
LTCNADSKNEHLSKLKSKVVMRMTQFLNVHPIKLKPSNVMVSLVKISLDIVFIYQRSYPMMDNILKILTDTSCIVCRKLLEYQNN